MSDMIPLPILSRALANHTGAQALPYRKIYQGALDGRFPAIQENGRWFVSRQDLDNVAEAFGLSKVAA